MRVLYARGISTLPTASGMACFLARNTWPIGIVNIWDTGVLRVSYIKVPLPFVPFFDGGNGRIEVLLSVPVAALYLPLFLFYELAKELRPCYISVFTVEGAYQLPSQKTVLYYLYGRIAQYFASGF